MRALILSGGGSKGQYHIGAVRRLLGDERICYDLYAGVSVGALVAAFLAQGKSGQEVQTAAALEKIFANIHDKDIYKRWPLGYLQVPWKPAIYTAAPLRKLIRKNLDPKLVRSSGKLLRIGATSLNTGVFAIFNERFEDLEEAVYASSAYPVAFEPQALEGQFFTDGGVRSVTPIAAAIQAGATHLDVVLCAPRSGTPSSIHGSPQTFETALRAVELMNDQIVSDDVKKAQLYNRLVEAGAEIGKKKVSMTVIRPDALLNKDSLHFSPAEAARLQAKGYTDARARK